MKTPKTALALLLLSLSCATHGAGDYQIRFQSRQFTPSAGVPADLAARLKREIASQPEAQRAHVLAQLRAPLDPAARRRLEKQGIVLLEPVSKRAWYAAVTSGGADALANSNLVRWADLVRPDDKIAARARPGAPVRPYQMRPDNRIAYSVSFHRDVRPAEVLALAKRTGAELQSFDSAAFPLARAVRVNLPQGRLYELARDDIVAGIDAPLPPPMGHNVVNAQPASRVDRVQAAPFNLDGSGITVGIWDPGLVYAAHRDLSPRVTVQAGQTGSIGDHATHVAGTIGASGQNVTNARGMAPNVGIASWNVTEIGIDDVAEMRTAASSIQVSNHSYGPPIGWDSSGFPFQDNQDLFGRYTQEGSASFDDVVFDTGLIVVKSAGNDRDDAANPPPSRAADCFQGGLGIAADCLDPIASAKNVITVGSVDSATAISTQSSFGPTKDGRIKPDVMAYGGSLGGPRTLSLGITSDVASAIRGGTSVSAGVVTGIVALVLQEANRRSMALSPAAVKALLIQTARDVQGAGQATVGPDFASGWGIVDAEAAIDLLRQGGIAEGTVSQPGLANAWKRNFFVPAGQAEVHLTLAWVDPAPAANAADVLVNDLDLRLIGPDGTQFAPWILNHLSPGTAAVRNGGNDAINNVEQVSVLNPMAGVWTVQVSAAELLQPPQSFAVAGLLPHSDIVLVMDRSGSMSLPSGTPGISKMQALQSAANELIDLLDLGGGHRLGLVQFQENTVPFVPAFDLQQLADTNVGQAHAAVNGMATGGWTNIISGVHAAAGQLGAAAPPYPRQAIMVFSDGKHNRPLGSNLASIAGTVQAGNYRFYSIGFGTDVDDAILSDVAAANHGIHVKEQDLSPIQLTKYFLTVGALAHDMSVLADPTYQLGAGESASLSVNVSRMDQSVTFAVNWTGQHAGEVQISLSGPLPKCPIPLVDRGGLRTRAAAHYRLIRVQLPFYCGGAPMHEGAWRVTARAGAMADQSRETVDIMVLADSRLKLDAKMDLPKDAKHLLLTASLLQDGKPLPKAGWPVMEAYVRMPRPPSDDSAKEDATRKGAALNRPPVAESPPRTMKVRLRDDGKNGDAKAGDGVFTATIDRADLPEGLLQARLVSRFQHGKLNLVREATTSAYIRH